EKSLVRRTRGRLWMLETIREFALERLEALPDAASIRERHAHHYCAVAESTNLSDSAPGHAQYELARDEQENFRAVLAWAVANRQAEVGLRLATALENFWVLNEPAEVVRWFGELFAQAVDVPAPVRAAALK